MPNLMNLLAWFNGKKTYITALATAVLALLQVLNVPVPEYVYTALAAVGLTVVRAAIGSVNAKVQALKAPAKK